MKDSLDNLKLNFFPGYYEQTNKQRPCMCAYVKMHKIVQYTIYELILAEVLFGVCTQEGFWRTL